MVESAMVSEAAAGHCVTPAPVACVPHTGIYCWKTAVKMLSGCPVMNQNDT
jgi:hypothetical protein